MLKENQNVLEKYNQERKDDGISPNTIHYQTNILGNFEKHINKSFKQATEEDTRSFIARYENTVSKDTVKTVLRVFFSWIYDLDNGDDLPECVRWIKFRTRRQKNREENIDYRDYIITEEEYQKLIFVASDIRHKAVLETLWIFGPRKSELCSMNANDIEDTGDSIIVTFRESKTKKRRVPCIEYPQYLLQWYDTHPYKNQKGKPLWLSRNRNKKYDMQRMKPDSINKLLKRLQKYAGIERKRLAPHDFRHTAISRDLANGMPDTHIETKYGLVHGTNVIRVYDHNGPVELLDWLHSNTPNDERPMTYDALERQKKQLEHEQQKAVNELENELRKEITILKNKFEKKTEIDNFIMDSLGVIAMEMVQTQGIDSIKEIFRKHNVPLVRDK
jgi:site-specific recombinase XerD